MSTQADRPLSPQFLDRATSDTLIKLLSEYTEKLRRLSDQVDRLEQQRYISLAIFASVAFVIATFVTSTLREAFSDPSRTAWFGAIEAVLPVIVVVPAYGYLTLQRRRVRVLRENMTIEADKLEKLVRRLSQVQEHINLDMGSEIEYDFRLTEAEAALRISKRYRTYASRSEPFGNDSA